MNNPPTHLDLLAPTLRALEALGGSANTTEITDKVIEKENISEEIQNLPQQGDSRSLLEYRLAWARTYLKKYLNALENSSRGVWSLTSDSRSLDFSNAEEIIRLCKERKNNDVSQPVVDGSEDVITEEDDDWREQLLNLIKSCTPDQFEKLSQRLLRESGCTDVNVVGRSGDQGIDGTAILEIGLISFSIKFQCKRYTSNPVTPREIREFQGSMTYQYDKGIFITTSTFTRGARNQAREPGNKVIDLIDGERLVNLIKQYQLGVSTEQQINEKVNIDAEWYRNL